MYQKYARLLGKRTTYASDIDRVGRQHFGARWGGVLARDTLPAPGHMRFFVVNTDASTGRGVHWLAAMDVDGQRHFNDPLGMIGADQRRQLERLHPDEVWADLDAEQRREEKDCGVRALVALEIGLRCGLDKYLVL